MANERLFRAIAFITAKHLMHYQAVMQAISSLGAWLMKQAAPALYEHAEQVLGQRDELQELRVLQAFYELQAMATRGGGWKDRHGPPLDQIANALIEQCGWDPDEVGEFVEELTEGHFAYSLAGDDEDDE